MKLLLIRVFITLAIYSILTSPFILYIITDHKYGFRMDLFVTVTLGIISGVIGGMITDYLESSNKY